MLLRAVGSIFWWFIIEDSCTKIRECWWLFHTSWANIILSSSFSTSSFFFFLKRILWIQVHVFVLLLYFPCWVVMHMLIGIKYSSHLPHGNKLLWTWTKTSSGVLVSGKVWMCLALVTAPGCSECTCSTCVMLALMQWLLFCAFAFVNCERLTWLLSWAPHPVQTILAFGVMLPHF